MLRQGRVDSEHQQQTAIIPIVSVQNFVFLVLNVLNIRKNDTFYTIRLYLTINVVV